MTRNYASSILQRLSKRTANEVKKRKFQNTYLPLNHNYLKYIAPPLFTTG